MSAAATCLAYLGLGSNEGDRADLLERALRHLEQQPGLRVLRSSSIYVSDPVGPVQDQEPFFNVVLEVRTALAPLDLLRRCQQVEAALGRRRDQELRQGPRPMDVDLLLVEGVVGQWPGLTLPHPELDRRAFVVLPLLELRPDLRDPRDGAPLSRLAGRLEAEQSISLVHDPLPLAAPAPPAAAATPALNLFTVSSLRLHLPRRMPPTPGRGRVGLLRRLLQRLGR